MRWIQPLLELLPANFRWFTPAESKRGRLAWQRGVNHPFLTCSVWVGLEKSRRAAGLNHFAKVVTIPSGDSLRMQWLAVSAINRFPLLS